MVDESARARRVVHQHAAGLERDLGIARSGSPASAIPPDSLVADFLVERGDDRTDLNVFVSRRGNWQVTMRAFHNKSLVNLPAAGVAVAHTLHVPSGDVQPIWDVAQRYRVAGERYGTGSSRDSAAKGQRLLGTRAVLAVSF